MASSRSHHGVAPRAHSLTHDAIAQIRDILEASLGDDSRHNLRSAAGRALDIATTELHALRADLAQAADSDTAQG